MRRVLTHPRLCAARACLLRAATADTRWFVAPLPSHAHAHTHACAHTHMRAYAHGFVHRSARHVWWCALRLRVPCVRARAEFHRSAASKLAALKQAASSLATAAVLLRVSVPLGVAGGADVVPPISTLVQPQLDEVLANMEFTDSILWARYVPAANRSAWEASTGLTIRDVGASFSRVADAPVGDSRTAYLPVTTYVQQQALTSNVYALQASLPGLNLLSEPLLAAAFDSAVAYGVDVCTPPMVTLHNALGAFIVSPVYAATSVNPMYLAPEERRALLVGAFIQQVSFATLIGDPLLATHSLRFLLRSPSPLLRSSAHAPPRL
ncbi:hypothetical protein EON67_09135, partial [archaeon]